MLNDKIILLWQLFMEKYSTIEEELLWIWSSFGLF